MDAESDETTEEGCNFITSHSESEFAVLAVDGLSRPVTSSIAASVKKLEVANEATGKLRCIQITLCCNGTFLKATADTESPPASFVNKTTVEYIVKSVHSAVVINEKERPIDTVYVDYSRKRIDLFGTLIVDLSSLGRNVKSAKFLISENRACCLLGLDLQSQLGVRTMQVRSPRPLVSKISQSDTNETSEFWRSHYQKKYFRIFSYR